MINKEDSVEIFEEEEIISISDENGKRYDYYQVACVEYKDGFYALMEPVDVSDDEDGIYVFKITNYDKPEEDWQVEPVLDEQVANAVYDIFEEVYIAKYGCGGNCEGCTENCPSKDEVKE